MKWILPLLVLLLVGCSQEALPPIYEPEIVVPENMVAPIPQDQISEQPVVAPEPTSTKEALLEQEVQVPITYGLRVSDIMYGYKSRKYYYTDETFGVQELHYTGPAPIMSSEQYTEISVYNIILTPEKKVDLTLYHYLHGLEIPGFLGETQSYVNRAGVKITIDKISEGKIAFTLEKVDPKLHTNLCPECIRIPQSVKADDDGVRTVDLRESETFIVQGREYEVTLQELDKDTQLGRLQISRQGFPFERLPFLKHGQTYVLNDGMGLRLLFSASRTYGALDHFAYAAFGFVPTQDLPLSNRCPECTDYAFLSEGQTQELRIGNVQEDITLRDSSILFDGKSTELLMDTMIPLTDEVSAILLDTEPQYQVGFVVKGKSAPSLYCKEFSDEGLDIKRKGMIRLATGSSGNVYERTDYCADESTLVEYSCVRIAERSYDGDDGKGARGQMDAVSCDCKKGFCVG